MRRASTGRSSIEVVPPGQGARAPISVIARFAVCLLGLHAVGGPVQARTSSQARGAITFTGGDGRSCDAAVVIAGARSTGEGLKAQARWIARNVPGVHRTASAITRRNDRTYEVVSLAGARSVCFDVSGFFGSW